MRNQKKIIQAIYLVIISLIFFPSIGQAVKQALRIPLLVVEDEKMHLQTLIQRFKSLENKFGKPSDLVIATTFEDALRHLQSRPFAGVIFDNNLPKSASDTRISASFGDLLGAVDKKYHLSLPPIVAANSGDNLEKLQQSLRFEPKLRDYIKIDLNKKASGIETFYDLSAKRWQGQQWLPLDHASSPEKKSKSNGIPRFFSSADLNTSPKPPRGVGIGDVRRSPSSPELSRRTIPHEGVSLRSHTAGATSETISKNPAQF